MALRASSVGPQPREGAPRRRRGLVILSALGLGLGAGAGLLAVTAAAPLGQDAGYGASVVTASTRGGAAPRRAPAFSAVVRCAKAGSCGGRRAITICAPARRRIARAPPAAALERRASAWSAPISSSSRRSIAASTPL